jgi:Uma2 family endonuclease
MATVFEEPLISDDELLYEIVDGQRVELSPMSAFAAIVASRLVGALHYFLVSHPLGEAVVETLFDLGLPRGQNRRPDVAFVSFTRWPRGQQQPLEADAWKVVPNIGVEVISPHNYVDDLLEKTAEYFQAGVEQVWVVYPRFQLVHVYESWTSVRVLTVGEDLEGGSILPGFRLPLRTLFPEQPDHA